MKRFEAFGRLGTAALSFVFAGALYAQVPGLTLPPSGNNQKAEVTQFAGPVKVRIEYSSPAVHTADGVDRRGAIWGKLVPYGMTDLGLSGRPSPWRAGANENTVFEVSHDVLIEGKPLPAGRYGLHMIAGPETWTLIFSKNSIAWGSFQYNEAEDALRVTVKPHKHEYREWLTYEFTARKPAETVAEMQWEELAVPWTVRVADPDEIYVSRLSQELTGATGFTWQGWDAAAQFCLTHDTHLEQGLKWSEIAANNPFVGDANFTTLSTKAQLLSKLGRQADAKTTMDAAMHLPSTKPIEIHLYGRSLLAQKKVDEAMAVFEYNATRFSGQWPTHVGLARGYAAKGDNKKALEQARLGLAQAPDALNRNAIEDMIKALEAGPSNR
jgi:tetratricopeptide (TPR) repeat protein